MGGYRWTPGVSVGVDSLPSVTRLFTISTKMIGENCMHARSRESLIIGERRHGGHTGTPIRVQYIQDKNCAQLRSPDLTRTLPSPDRKRVRDINGPRSVLALDVETEPKIQIQSSEMNDDVTASLHFSASRINNVRHRRSTTTLVCCRRNCDEGRPGRWAGQASMCYSSRRAN